MTAKSDVQWAVHVFDDMTLHLLYEILQLRTQVFVVEQDCVYQDMDGHDEHDVVHFTGHLNEVLVAYSRIFAPAKKHARYTSIGRIVTHGDYRGLSLGKELVQRSIEYCKTHFPGIGIHISAQCYLDDFYSAFGFKTISEVYLEDGIDHQEMLLEF